MIFYLLAVLMLLCCSMTFSKAGEFNKEYLSVKTTNSVKGVFVLLIFLSHSAGYIELTGIYDHPYVVFKEFMNQMVVTLFFFYSGYGMMESIKKKGMDYVMSIPFYRFFKVLFNFWMALLVFMAANLILKNRYDLKTTLLAFTGWTAIGNSAWYMFAIFVMYIFTFISFFAFRKPKFLPIAVLTLMTAAFVFLNIRLERPKYCYNTVMLFPLGFWYSYLKERIEKILCKNDIIYFFCASAMAGIMIFEYFRRWNGIEDYTVWVVSFTMLIIMFTMKVNISNSIIEWFGKHIFSIYILQRIPMMFLERTVLKEHPYMFVFLSFCLTLFIASVFDEAVGRLDGLIFRRVKKEDNKNLIHQKNGQA